MPGGGALPDNTLSGAVLDSLLIGHNLSSGMCCLSSAEAKYWRCNCGSSCIASKYCCESAKTDHRSMAKSASLHDS
eukprot:982263-Ditylum_brightwellii.AAC.1